MGHKAAFVRNRSRTIRRDNERTHAKLKQRGSTSNTVKKNTATTRVSVQTAASSQVQKRTESTVVLQHKLPSVDELKSLWNQASQAVRVPRAVWDILAVLSMWERKEAVDIAQNLDGKSKSPILDALRKLWEGMTTDTTESGSTANCLRSIIFDENVVKVVLATLDVAAANIEGENRAEDDIRTLIVEAVLAVFQGDDSPQEDLLSAMDIHSLPQLALHGVGRLIIHALLKHGTVSQRKVLNKALAGYCLRFADHRHGSHVIVDLLKYYPKSSKTILPALSPKVVELSNDAVGAEIAVQLITPSTCEALIEKMTQSPQDPLQDKRCRRFVTTLAERGLNAGAEGHELLPTSSRVSCLHSLFAAYIQPRARSLAEDSKGNLLLQAFIKAAASFAEGSDILGKLMLVILAEQDGKDAEQPKKRLLELLHHPIGTHVISCLASSGNKKVVTYIIDSVTPKLNLLATKRHSSLALRRMFDTADVSFATAFMQSLDKNQVAPLIMDQNANLVVQAALKRLSTVDRRDFFVSHLKSDLVQFCRHQFAAHVVVALLEPGMLDPSTHMEIFSGVKGSLVELAQHVNGRFVVEKMLSPHREARDMIFSAFLSLAYCKGSHHVLLKLYESVALIDERPPKSPGMGPKGKAKKATEAGASRTEIARVIADNLESLSCEGNATLVVQKLLQSDLLRSHEGKVGSKRGRDNAESPVLAAVQQVLKLKPAIASRLKQDFFGRFVIGLVEGAH